MTAAVQAGRDAVVRPIRIASRASALALTQSGQIGARLADAFGVPVTVVEVVSQGDTDPRALTRIGGTGVFVSALRTALADGIADVAVHSLKDLPTAPELGLVVAAIPVREDPADVLVSAGSKRLAELAPGARVGTGSPRRAAALQAVRPDLAFVAVRGNIDTRIAKVRAGSLDAVVLARAGLARLGRLADVAETFGPDVLLPAPGQGALAIECRADDELLGARLRDVLDHATSRSCVEAERAVLAGLDAGCSAPVGALARIDGAMLVLTAAAGPSLRATAKAPYRPGTEDPEAAEALGRRVARALLNRGAGALVGIGAGIGAGPGAGQAEQEYTYNTDANGIGTSTETDRW